MRVARGRPVHAAHRECVRRILDRRSTDRCSRPYCASLPGLPAGYYYENYHNGLAYNPCPSNGSLP